MLETMAGFAFLAVATGFAVQMHHSGLSFDQHSMDRLEQQLAVENVGQRFLLVPYEDIERVAEQRGRESDIQIQIDTFETGSQSGLHLAIQATIDSQTLQHHVWRMEPAE
ncbi:hypothetical protein RBSH_05996 [Rhodopirellula baltica SH28]|uniref:Uncharacterized protein n=2 Tax=Rhodopirellula baltica TaxID=265606 RepID=K5D799_RHOBT|nr:hypothetical protein [Rhodopirellula baltica]EKJ98683.1 hypothetical protein RBSH_05996 [Rhodopirellula baltica SH28]